MITVPEAARRVDRNPETIRRWIRSGRLRSQKVGTQHLIDERELDLLVNEYDELDDVIPVHPTWTGEPQVNWAGIVRRSRAGR
ncbi:MAG TPA: helix-turn-helix domain-containing protein [Gaiella sp.]|nr:helix-turn-helix domain-containing protein [Gaiella sp.]